MAILKNRREAKEKDFRKKCNKKFQRTVRRNKKRYYIKYKKIKDGNSHGKTKFSKRSLNSEKVLTLN